MDTLDRLQQNIHTTRLFQPFGGEEIAALLERPAEPGQSGDHESYKARLSL